ncbi:MAG: PAS domain S-box protein [Desulfobacterales bacterium]
MKDDHKTKKQLIDELTELRSQNDELKKSENLGKYRLLVENIRDVIYELDDQGVVLYISPAVRDVLGYDLPEIEGKNFTELAHKDDLGHLTEWFSELRKGIEQPSEYRVSNKSGELRWARTKARPIMEEGLFKGARGILIDVTEQRRVEKALKESEEKYRELVKYAPAGIYEVDYETGRFTSVNDVICEYTGYTRDELLNTNLYNLLTEESQKLMRERIEKLSAGEKMPQTFEYCIRTKGGEKLWAILNARYIYEEGKLKGATGIIYNINERKRAEEALLESEEKYRWVLDNMADVITVMDMNLRFTYVSPSVVHMRGYTAEEAVAQTFEQVMTPESLQISAKVFEEEMKLEASGTADPDRIRIVEVEQYRKDGSIVLMENHLSFMRDEAKKAVGIISVSSDITARKQAEEALKESENKYRMLADNFNDVIFVLDMNLNYTYVSPSVKILRGYDPEEVLKQQPSEILAPSSLDLAMKTLSEIMELEKSKLSDMPKSKTLELEMIRKDGSTVWTEVKFSFIRDENQQAVSILGLTRDITERKRAEEALRENEERYKALFDRSLDLVYITDLEGRFLDANQAALNRLGYNREEISSLNFATLLSGDQIPIAFQMMQEIIDTGYQKNVIELRLKAKNGNDLFVETIGSVILKYGIPYAVQGIARDITERKKAEEALQESEERFRRIFDEGPFGMGLESPDSTIIAANKLLCELLGYTEQELIGKGVADITHKEDRDKSKELLGQLFASSIPVFRQEKRYIRKNGTILWANTSISAIQGKEGDVRYALAIIEDRTESRTAADKIHLLAYYDSLTGLPNRTFHKEIIKKSIEHAQRHKEIFALIYIGLDNFKRINDTLGYRIGDLLLKAVADRLTNSLRKSDHVARADEGGTADIVSRVGGDEFIVLAHDLNQAQDAARTYRRLLDKISAPYDLSGREVFITFSIGIALYPDDGTNVDDLLKNAEKAMRHTKSEGKNNFHFYSKSMHSSVLEHLTLENNLYRALERKELVLYYQPKVDAATRRVKGMEALIRWIHPDKGLIPPMQFIPMAETSGLIIPIGEFVIHTVCKQIRTWQDAGFKEMNVALNISSYQFDKQNLLEIVKKALQDTMISPQCLQLEITESTIMRNPDKAIKILTDLNALGIGIAIDDFGTGYSSLSHLKRLPLDSLKIDQSFVKGVASDPRDQAIVRTTIAMAHSLNLKTIAEGVETEEQLSFLQEHGCDEIQGYLFSRPLPAEEIPGILVKGYL